MANLNHFIVAVVLSICLFQAATAVQLGSMFKDNIVLQQGKDACFWGSTKSNAGVTLKYLAVENRVQADGNGIFQVCGAPGAPKDGVFDVTVAAEGDADDAVLNNAVFGDVYFCSGQSNMQMTLSMAFGGKEVIAAANDPALRLFSVKRVVSDTPQWDITDSNNLGWAPASPTSTGGPDWTYFSAVCYLFGAEIRKSHPDTPIGIIDSDWGGTYIQTWMSPDALKQCPDHQSEVVRFMSADSPLVAAANSHSDTWAAQGVNPNRPSVCYNQMVFPFLRMPIRGVLWYQGESNAGDTQYGCRFKAMIEDWRVKWNNPDMPFLFVQIAPFVNQDKYSYAFLRQMQEAALQLPNVAMANTIDLGDKAGPWTSIHPRDKGSVAHRLALAAENVIYGDKSVLYNGPVVSSISPVKVSGGSWEVTVTFDKATLAAKPDLQLSGTAQCDQCCTTQKAFVFSTVDYKFFDATSVTFDGNDSVTVVLQNAPAGATVANLLLEFDTYPECALFDKAQGLPARPFMLPVKVANAPFKMYI